jgi:ATP-dependent helicase/nuclease subunit A
LLLNGTSPAKILCLTFTKAAAANMANRIFATLGQWITFDDDALDKAIAATGAAPGGAKQRKLARQLFASVLDTPGGLKVQTIHGFCARLLQQFPFEANVTARFRVMEETEQQQMLEDIRRQVLLRASNEPDSAAGRALATVIPMANDLAIQDALAEALRERARIMAWLDAAGGLASARAQLSAALGVTEDDTLAAVETEIVDGPHLPCGEWESVAKICSAGSATDKARGLAMLEATRTSGPGRIESYFEVFFTRERKLRGSPSSPRPSPNRILT